MADNLYLSALRTQTLPYRIEEFIDFRIVDIARRTITKAIHNEASLKNMPQRYIDGIHTEFIEGELWVWVDFKGKNNQPLDLFFEEGTRDHFIKPKIKKALSWISKGAIGIFSGLRLFSKNNFVSGIEARHIFRNGVQKGYPEFKKQLTKEVEEYMEETVLFDR